MRQAVGRRDVVKRDFDVLDGLAVMGRGLYRPLVLVKQCDRADQGQVFHVIAARAGLTVQEGQLPGIRIDDKPGFQEALGVAVHFQYLLALFPGKYAFDRLLFALQPVDRLGLAAVFIDRQHQAAVQELFVELDGSRRQEDHDRAFARDTGG